MKTLLGTLVALPLLLSAAGEAKAADHGEYKLKIDVRTAEKWKVRWICDNGTTHSTFDTDTYKGWKTTTRTNNVTADKCSSGNWYLQFRFHHASSSWDTVDTGYHRCYNNECGYYTGGQTTTSPLRPTSAATTSCASRPRSPRSPPAAMASACVR